MPSNTPTSADLLTARFRTADAYELVLFDRLSAGQQTAFAELQRDPNFYGLLRPRHDSTRTIKAVTRDSALLLLSLTTPGSLPFFVRREPNAVEAISDLVLSGILEIEHDGEFVSGVAATSLLVSSPTSANEHPLTRLSLDAIRFAAEHRLPDVGRVAGELYQFNRQPLTPRWSRALRDREAVLSFAGLEAGSPARRELVAEWDIDARGDSQAWIYFVHRGPSSSQRTSSSREDAYKLYVSPALADFPRAFAAVSSVASRRGVRHLKIGSDASGLLRPDKLVLYFPDLDSLLGSAREIEDALPDVAAQGVPFTAPIDPRGLLSWGADPPSSAQPLSWQAKDSWRTWLVSRLASSLLEGQESDPETRVQYALDRLRRDGVDTQRWVANTTAWNTL
jgi:hypothetical protein